MQRKCRDVVLCGGAMTVRVVPVLKDNFSYVMRCNATSRLCLVDCPDHVPVLNEAQTMLLGGDAAKLQLDASNTCVFATHKHGDHAPNAAVPKLLPGVQIYAGKHEPQSATKATVLLDDGDVFAVGNIQCRVLHVPCHTKGHVAFYCTAAGSAADGAGSSGGSGSGGGALFSGDTLFAGGIGAFFEGDAAQMIAALRKIATVCDDATHIFPGHEYSLNFFKYAAQVEPANASIRAITARMNELAAAGVPTVPSTLAEEKAANPFVRAALGVKDLIAALPEQARVSDVAAMQYLYDNCP